MYNEWITKLLGKKNWNGQLCRSHSLLPQGGSAKNTAMFFYLREGQAKNQR